MSVGIRIMAEEVSLRRRCLFVVPHPGRRLADGSPKEYHLRTDEHGAVLVSETVWRRIQEIMAANPFAPRFMVVGQTRRPPMQIIGGDETLPVERFDGDRLHRKGALTVVKQTLRG